MELPKCCPPTGQITSKILRLSFFANNLYGELGIAEIRATMTIDYAQIDAML